jgi:multicomponent Na+:H+ antiporter subunit E
MSRFLTTFLLSFLLYLALTTGTGHVGIWNTGELVTGLILSLLVGALVGPVLPGGWAKVLHPRRWLVLLVYLVGPFFWAMAKANLDVVYRVITGNIKPGIVRIAPRLPNDVSTTLLANSITLTPGTLTVEVDEKTNDLFIHWINVDEAVLRRTPRDHSGICGSFPQWARRIAA